MHIKKNQANIPRINDQNWGHLKKVEKGGRVSIVSSLKFSRQLLLLKLTVKLAINACFCGYYWRTSLILTPRLIILAFISILYVIFIKRFKRSFQKEDIFVLCVKKSANAQLRKCTKQTQCKQTNFIFNGYHNQPKTGKH